MGKNPNPIYIATDLVEDILFRLPLKSILKFKAVSKQWRSILESRRFAERRMSVTKNLKILAVGDGSESRFYSGDEEMKMVYLKGDDATRPSLTCDGLVCIPGPGWVNVLNPSTGELLSFPSDGPSHSHYDDDMETIPWWNVFSGYWEIGFGKDKVNGSYKVVRMSTDDDDCEILDVNIGEWRKLNPPPYKINANRKSAFVNGSIYWIDLYTSYYRLLALDLHTEEFRDLAVLPPPWKTPAVHLVNLQDRLAVTKTTLFSIGNKFQWNLEIWSMDAQEERWSMTYSISLSDRNISKYWWVLLGFMPVAVSKQGSLFLYDSDKRLLKYCPETDLLVCLSQDICVLCPFVENLVSLGPKSSTSIGYRCGVSSLNQGSGSGSQISNIVRRMESLFPNILLTSALVSLVIFGYRYRYST